MGLDTTHGCWHGPYSSFMAWRAIIHGKIAGQKTDDPAWYGAHEATREGLTEAWKRGLYGTDHPVEEHLPADADDITPWAALCVLMNHSDCDGSIPWRVCGLLAEQLEGLGVDEGEDGGLTARFVAGLRLAHSAGEDVEFG